MSEKINAYFSHSWSPDDLPINLMLWQRLAEQCNLLIDNPVPTETDEQPYFISRIESLMRRADVFVGCLPLQPEEKWGERGSVGDHRYNRCSPYILFELRLAERADLPRFILYDLNSGFTPPANPPSHVRYLPRRFGELKKKIAAGNTDKRSG